MNCPKCDKEMSEGYLKVSSGHGCGFLEWIKNKRLFSFRDPEHFNIVISSFFSEYIPAFRCQSCKQITFSYNEEVNEAIENDRDMKKNML